MKQSVGINSLIFPNPVIVAGTYDEQGEPNAATLAWGGIGCSDPQSVTIAVRPSRHTFEALQRTKAFTVNLPSAVYAAETDFFGLASGRNTRKFEATGLTPVHGEFVDAPYIAEFPYCMECVVTHTLDLGSHTLFVGAVKDVKVDELYVNEQGVLDFEKANILSFDPGIKAYRAPGEFVGQAYSIGKKFISK